MSPRSRARQPIDPSPVAAVPDPRAGAGVEALNASEEPISEPVRIPRPWALADWFTGPWAPIRITQLAIAAAFVLIHLVGAPQRFGFVDRFSATAMVGGTAVLCAISAVHAGRRRSQSAGLGREPGAWSEAWAWWLLAAAHAGVAFHELALSKVPGAGRDLTDAGLRDVPLLLLYPLIYVAIWLLTRARIPRWQPSTWWDGAIVALGAVAAGLALPGVLDGAAGPLPSDLASSPAWLLYPLADLLLVTVVLWAVTVSGSPPGSSLWWLGTGLAVLTMAESLALHTAVVREAEPGWGVELLWLAGFFATGLATTDNPGPLTPDRRRVAPSRLSRATLPALALAIALAVLAQALVGRAMTDWAWAAALACVTVGLLRLGLAVWEQHARGVRPGGERTDDVTGLANRKALAEALALDSGLARGQGWRRWTDQIALLLVDLDRFKDVNEALGHDAGDRLLVEVAARLGTVLRPHQMFARLGGDEFAVLLPGAGPSSAQRVAEALRACLDDPFEFAGTRLHIRASVGLATAQLPDDEPADLLRQADVAMTRAKKSPTGIAIFDPARDQLGPQRLRRIDELRSALDRGELEVHLQPQVRLHGGGVVGAEALARWRHPQDGVLLPEAFLPLAAQTGLMLPVAQLVLDRALGACAQWWRRGHNIPVSVNLTADDLADREIADKVASALAKHGLPGSALHIEITEDVLLTDPERTARLLTQWRADGVHISLDDYGTGYSSLAYLRALPVDELKLDQVFASDLQRRTTTTIVRHTIAMAHGLGLRVVAEGVEDEATARALTDLGCDIGQGLFFGPAMTAEEFLQVLPARA